LRRVLFLAYHFPPVGGAGVQRTVKFVRYLREFGYDSVVVTGPGTTGGRWTPTDETLLAELPPDLEVRRIATPEPVRAAGLRARTERSLRLRSEFTRWWVAGSVGAATASSRVDLVIATMSPFESAEAATAISQKLDVPWVADLRDPWALDEMQIYQTGLHKRLELASMGDALGSAAAIVMNTPEAARRLVATFPAFKAGRVATIPNGFDRTDFDGPTPLRTDDRYRIVHAGYLHADLAHEERGLRRILGGSVRGVERTARSLVYLCEAIRRLRDREPALVDRLELHVAGVLSDADRQTLPQDLMCAHGYLSHARAIALMRSAELLFLPLHDLPRGQRATIVPGKTYEYLAAARPILAALPDGDARDLVAQASGAIICRPTDVTAMETALAQMLRDGTSHDRQPDSPPAFLEPFERRHLARELAAVFDRTLSESAKSR